MKKILCIFANSDMGKISQIIFDFKEAQSAVWEPSNTSWWLSLEKKQLTSSWVWFSKGSLWWEYFYLPVEHIFKLWPRPSKHPDTHWVLQCSFQTHSRLLWIQILTAVSPSHKYFHLSSYISFKNRVSLFWLIYFLGVLELMYSHCKIRFVKTWLSIFCILTPKYLLHPQCSDRLFCSLLMEIIHTGINWHC